MPHPNELSRYPKEGRRVAYAVIRDDPPRVYVAQDEDVLQRVIALEVVAACDPRELGQGTTDHLRELLLSENWGLAIQAWMAATGSVLDLYPDESIWLPSNISEDRVALELAVSRLFRDP